MNKDTISRAIVKNNITKVYIVEENEKQHLWVDTTFY